MCSRCIRRWARMDLARPSGCGPRWMKPEDRMCYWPNLGYARFGTKVVMEGAPRWCTEELFDARRVRLADIDGSGTTDLVYIGADGVHACFNQSGNAFAARVLLAVFP